MTEPTPNWTRVVEDAGFDVSLDRDEFEDSIRARGLGTRWFAYDARDTVHGQHELHTATVGPPDGLPSHGSSLVSVKAALIEALGRHLTGETADPA